MERRLSVRQAVERLLPFLCRRAQTLNARLDLQRVVEPDSLHGCIIAKEVSCRIEHPSRSDIAEVDTQPFTVGGVRSRSAREVAEQSATRKLGAPVAAHA
jgi:hypothetical protein